METFEQIQSKLVTLRDFVRWAATEFQRHGLYFGHGTDNPLDEALALVLHALALDHTVPPEMLDSRLTVAEQRTIHELVRRRIEERIPLPYLTHEAHFAGLRFYVDERVLIPRSPLAELIEQGFEPWHSADTVQHVLDIGTGSGCIAVACAVALPDARVDATDISADALAVAALNVQRHGVGSRVRLQCADLYPPATEYQYDVIVSNPPYVDAADMDALPAEYRHEPALALVAGPHGLDCARRIVAGARERLADDGILVLEVGNSRGALERELGELPWTWVEFERGGEGVAVLTAAELRAQPPDVAEPGEEAAG